MKMDFSNWMFLLGGMLLIILGFFDRWANSISGTTVMGLLMILTVSVSILQKKQTDVK